MITPTPPSRQVRRAQARQKRRAPNPESAIQARTAEIVAEGQAQAAAPLPLN
jgi:hypothetical protein